MVVPPRRRGGGDQFIKDATGHALVFLNGKGKNLDIKSRVPSDPINSVVDA